MKKKRRWLRVLIGGVVLIVALRFAIFLVIPWQLGAALEGMGLRGEYERLDVSFLSGDMEIWHLRIWDDREDPMVHLEYARADLEVLDLLTGDIAFRRVEVDGLDVRLDHTGGDTRSDEPEEAPPSEPSPVSLDIPVRIDALRLQHAHVWLRDETVHPPLETRIDLDVRVSDLGSPDRPGRVEVVLAAADILDALRIEGRLEPASGSIDGEVEVRLRGLRPGSLEAYLAPLGIESAARTIDADLRCSLEATPDPEDPRSIRGMAEIEGVSVRADGESALEMKKARVEIDPVGPDRIVVPVVSLEGLEAQAMRLPTGALRVAGLDLLSRPAEEAGPAADPGDPSPGSPPEWFVKDVHLRDIRAGFRDAAVDPEAALSVILEDLRIRDVGKGMPTTLEGILHGPGVFENLLLRGSVTPGADETAVELDITSDGIRPDAIRPYLRAAGVEALMQSASFEMGGTIRLGDRLDVDVGPIRFTDGEDLLSLERVRVRGMETGSEIIHIEEVDLSGSGLGLRRDGSGAWEALGFRFTGGPPGPPPPEEEVPAEVPLEETIRETLAGLPGVIIHRVILGDHRLHLRDETQDPPLDVSLSDLGLEVENLRLGPRSRDEDEPTRIRGWIVAEEIAHRLHLSGTISASPDAPGLRIGIEGEQIRTDLLEPYLLAAGLESAVPSHTLRLTLAARAWTTGPGAGLDLSVEDLAAGGPEGDWISLERASLEGIRLGQDRMEARSVEIVSPRARLEKGEDGSLLVAGFRMQPRSPGEEAGTPSPSGPPPTLRLRSLAVEDARVAWRDASVTPPVSIEPRVDLSLGDLDTAPGAAKAPLRLQVGVPEVLDALTVEGEIDLGQADLTLAARGLRLDSLSPYLGPRVRPTLRDGRFDAKVVASMQGKALDLSLSDLALRDGEDPLLSLDGIRVDVPRLDPAGGVVEVREMSLTGLESEIHTTSEGHLSLLGIRMIPGETREEEPPPPEEEAAGEPPALPRIAVETLSVGIRRLALIDDRAPDAPPIVFTNWTLGNPESFEVTGSIPLSLSGKVDPFIDGATFHLVLEPLASHPEADVTVAIDGIHGDRLIEALPHLAGRMEAGSLRDGQLRAKLSAVVRLNRKHPLDFSLADSRGLEMTLADVSLTGGGGQEALVGLREVRVDVARLDPGSGDLHVREIDILRPQGILIREEGGIEVAGIRMRSSPHPETEPVEEDVPHETGGSTIRIDRMVLSDIDFEFEDRTTERPTRVPLSALDVEVTGIHRRGAKMMDPVKFQVFVQGGDVDLPVRKPSFQLENVIPGIGDIFGSGREEKKEKKEKREARKLFDEITATGEIEFQPAVKGRVQVNVRGVELVNFGDLAKKSGVALSDGVLDSAVTMRLQPDGSADIESRWILHRLDLSEPEGGPISTYLRLPAPLGAVVYLLRDRDGALRIPLNFTVEQEGIGSGAIAAAAVSTLSSTIANAVAKSPFRITTGALDFVGVGVGLSGRSGSERYLRISFPGGDVSFQGGARDALAQLAEALRHNGDMEVTLRHELGSRDVRCSRVVANPTEEECQRLVTLLRGRKEVLRREHRSLSERCAAAHAAGLAGQAEALRREMESLNQEVYLVEDGLESVFGLLDPRSRRQAWRRTRSACAALGDVRLEVVRQRLVEIGGEEVKSRIQVLPARYTIPSRPRGVVTAVMRASPDS